MSRQEIYQRYETKTLLVKIKEDKERYLKRKEGEKIYCALLFIIKEQAKEEIRARYSYVFKEKTAKNDINEFIKNFLEDPEFRNEKAILEEGQKNYEVFQFAHSDGVNLQCRNQIYTLNKKKIIDDSDFEILRTQGMDKYSRMNLDTIEELIEPEIMLQIKNKFKHSAKVLKTCRWYLRGLNIDLAIKKVISDDNVLKDKKRQKE